ncbi:TolC family protein [Vibrio ouci]|uniref:TolC family protein n=1 Tax=Vibrio ouci TaxID=2499078 RepID=A0A4Y8WI99_9VIBR|nr:TolC family protein [Vibrio ouci]TFH92549.1 TolC family protein [Vibrio ouci]
MIKRYLPHIGCVILVTTFSLPNYAISIEQAWQEAKKYDPSYEQAKIDVQLGEVNINASRSSLLPNLGASASASWSETGDSTTSYGTSLSQTIFNSSLWSDLDFANANYITAQLKLIESQNALANKLLSAYLNVASAQGDLQLAQSKWDEGNKLLKITETRFKAGKIRSVEVDQIHTMQVSEKAAILRAQAKLEVKRTELVALINLVPQSVNQVRTDSLVQPPMIVNSKNQWLKLAMDSSPELLVAIQNVKATEFAKDSAKGGYYPTLEGKVNYGDDNEFNASISLNVPIDLNGATRAKVDKASLSVLRAKHDLRRVKIEVQKHVTQRLTEVHFNWNRVLIENELVTSSEKVLRSQEKLYESGLVEVSEVIKAHNKVFLAKYNLKKSWYDYWRERIGLLKIAGKLDDSSIALISQVFVS